MGRACAEAQRPQHTPCVLLDGLRRPCGGKRWMRLLAWIGVSSCQLDEAVGLDWGVIRHELTWELGEDNDARRRARPTGNK